MERVWRLHRLVRPWKVDIRQEKTACRSHNEPYPLKEQVARIGNSVVPVMAQALVKANCSYLAVGERTKNIVIDTSGKQLRIAI